MKLKFFIFFSFFILHSSFIISCQCPLTSLSLSECNKYSIIFRGRIVKDSLYEHKKGEVLFKITELYKGLAAEEFTVLFDSNNECAQVFSVGEEWIIYTDYKQATNAKMVWCSRSRKYFKNEKLDFYAVTYGCSYDEELKFLRGKLGLHKPLASLEKRPDWTGNQIPTQTEFVVYLLISIASVVLFIYLFKKYFKW